MCRERSASRVLTAADPARSGGPCPAQSESHRIGAPASQSRPAPGHLNLPIVMATGADPVDFGLVQSLSHPGGNVTGLTNFAEELASPCRGFCGQDLERRSACRSSGRTAYEDRIRHQSKNREGARPHNSSADEVIE